MKLEANRVRVEGSTREPRPLDRSFALFYPLLSRPALVVEPDDILRRMTQVRDNESNAREQLSEVPLHFGDNPTRTRPTRRLVVEALVESLHVVRRTPDRPLEQMTDSRLENLISRKADRVLNPFGFQELVHIRLSEGGIASKGDACRRSSVACDHRLENRFPSVGAVHVAGAERASFQVARLIEDEERMVAGAAEMPVPDAALLIAMRRAYARIHIEHDAFA